MPVNYSVSMMGNPINASEPKKAYAKSQISGEISLKELSRMVSSQTTVSRADVYAVLISTVENLVQGLCDGKQVDFGDLGKFRLQISSTGAETAAQFTSNNITGVNVQFIPGEDLKNLLSGIEFTTVPTRLAMKAVLKAQKAGQTTVDISTKSSGGGSDPDDGNHGGSGSDGNENENPLG